MHPALTEKEQDLLVKNIVLACDKIEKLSRKSYKYLHVRSGFIAHYDHDGFIRHYSNHSLREQILRNTHFNTRCMLPEGDSFFLLSSSEAEVYKKIANLIT